MQRTEHSIPRRSRGRRKAPVSPGAGSMLTGGSHDATTLVLKGLNRFDCTSADTVGLRGKWNVPKRRCRRAANRVAGHAFHGTGQNVGGGALRQRCIRKIRVPFRAPLRRYAADAGWFVARAAV